VKERAAVGVVVVHTLRNETDATPAVSPPEQAHVLTAVLRAVLLCTTS